MKKLLVIMVIVGLGLAVFAALRSGRSGLPVLPRTAKIGEEVQLKPEEKVFIEGAGIEITLKNMHEAPPNTDMPNGVLLVVEKDGVMKEMPYTLSGFLSPESRKFYQKQGIYQEYYIAIAALDEPSATIKVIPLAEWESQL